MLRWQLLPVNYSIFKVLPNADSNYSAAVRCVPGLGALRQISALLSLETFNSRFCCCCCLTQGDTADQVTFFMVIWLNKYEIKAFCCLLKMLVALQQEQGGSRWELSLPWQVSGSSAGGILPAQPWGTAAPWGGKGRAGIPASLASWENNEQQSPARAPENKGICYRGKDISKKISEGVRATEKQHDALFLVRFSHLTMLCWNSSLLNYIVSI